jgi:hypothetical protein
MTCSLWPSFDPKLTWDGLLTFITGILAFFAGLLAFFGIRSQIHHADAGLQRQLDAEKKAREEASNAQRRAVATALLFEIDSQYVSNVRDILKSFDEQDAMPALTSTGPDPFPVYVGNANMLGSLPASLVEVIVNYYGDLRDYVAVIDEYAHGYEMHLQGNTIGRSLMKSLVPKIKSDGAAIIQLTYTICGLLCDFAGTAFSCPPIRVVQDPQVVESTRTDLSLRRQRLTRECAG